MVFQVPAWCGKASTESSVCQLCEEFLIPRNPDQGPLSSAFWIQSYFFPSLSPSSCPFSVHLQGKKIWSSPKKLHFNRVFPAPWKFCSFSLWLTTSCFLSHPPPLQIFSWLQLPQCIKETCCCLLWGAENTPVSGSFPFYSVCWQLCGWAHSSSWRQPRAKSASTRRGFSDL